MKLAYAQLTQHLQQQLSSLYLISGEELLLVQECVDQIRVAAKNRGFSEWVSIAADSQTAWEEIFYEEIYATSLFSEKRLLALDLKYTKLNQAHSKILQSYCEKIPENTLLIIYNIKIDAKNQTSAWYRLIEKKGVTIPIWPVSAEQLPQWIMQRAQKNKLNISRETALWLAQQVEGNLLAAAQEIEKLSLLENPSAEDIQTAVSDQSHFNIFNLIDTMLMDDKQRLSHILKNLRMEGIEPVLILWAITRELRTMVNILFAAQKGISLFDAFKKFGIWEKRQPAVRTFLKKQTLANCLDSLIKAAEIDRIIKGAEMGLVWDRLEELVCL